MGGHSIVKVPQEVLCVAKVTVGSSLGGSVPMLLHDGQVCPGKHKRHRPVNLVFWEARP